MQNNVYDYELNQGSGTAIAYVPTDIDSIRTGSYTHLDVYKRQGQTGAARRGDHYLFGF